MNIRNQDLTLIDIVKSWRPRHIKTIHNTEFARFRVDNVYRNVAARFIQKNVRKALLMYYRHAKKRLVMRKLKEAGMGIITA